MRELLDDLPPEFSRQQLHFVDPLRIGELELKAAQVIQALAPFLTPERVQKIDQVVRKRSRRFVPVLEGIYDLGNLSAVMRSLEAFGFLHLHLILRPGAKFRSANRVTKGSHKWLDVRRHASPEAAVRVLRASGYRVYATHFEGASPIETLDFSAPTAIVFGNEKDGVSKELLSEVDGRVVIPMVGFSQSFNISVAAALTCYHAFRELERLGGAQLTVSEQQLLKAQYYLRCLDNPEQVLRPLVSP